MDRWLGERDAPELRNLANQIVGPVEDTDLSSLGVAGLVVVLFRDSLTRFRRVCFNALWHIQISRSLIRKLTDYLGVVVTIPLVLISVPTLTSLINAGQQLSGFESMGVFILEVLYRLVRFHIDVSDHAKCSPSSLFHEWWFLGRFGFGVLCTH